jgi:hypothetical protein
MNNDLDTPKIGSSPTSGAIFPNENVGLANPPKDSPNISDGFGDEEEQNVKLFKRVLFAVDRTAPLAFLTIPPEPPRHANPGRTGGRAR